MTESVGCLDAMYVLFHLFSCVYNNLFENSFLPLNVYANNVNGRSLSHAVIYFLHGFGGDT